MSRAGSVSTRDTALAYLLSRIDYERALVMPYGDGAYQLERMCALLERLGRPQDRLPIIHVAGTKGKGSTSAMIAAILTAAGYRTGLFTSPHLERIEERFIVDGQLCSEVEFAQLVDRLRPEIEELDRLAAQGIYEIGPTYFEVTTAMALEHFVRQGAQAAVLEVGLGGRLDSTNVCNPMVSVITSISFDHMKQLGNTLAAIAGEKGGIIKPGRPVISGVLAEEARLVIQRMCDERGAPCTQLDRDFTFHYHAPRQLDEQPALPTIDFHSDRPVVQDLAQVDVGLLGRHQGANAAVALATIQELIRQGWSIPESALRAGLKGVRWPGRVEVLGRHPTVVLDAAHNVASIEALLATLDESFSARRRLLIFASTRDKDLAGMLALVIPRFDRIVLTQYLNNPRRVPPTELLDTARTSVEPRLIDERCVLADSPTAAWSQIHEWARPDDLVCITGSFFIAAETRAQITQRPLSAERGD